MIAIEVNYRIDQINQEIAQLEFQKHELQECLRLQTIQSQDQPIRSRITQPLDKIILQLLALGAKTRPELVSLTGRARTTVWDALTRLDNLGLIGTYNKEPEGKGRPEKYFQIKIHSGGT